jgi:hypothetical protein
MLLLLFQVLRAAELPDCAYTYVQACQEAGLLIPQQQPLHHQQQGRLAGRQSREVKTALISSNGSLLRWSCSTFWFSGRVCYHRTAAEQDMQAARQHQGRPVGQSWCR